MVNNSAVSIRLSIATYQIFFLSIMSGSSKLLDSDSRLYFPVIYGVISLFASTLNSVNNVATQI